MPQGSGTYLSRIPERNVENMDNMHATQHLYPQTEQKTKASQILAEVYDALKEKGYNPTNQIVGYIMSGDPTYITSYKSARSMIMRVERDELLEELVNNYIANRLA